MNSIPTVLCAPVLCLSRGGAAGPGGFAAAAPEDQSHLSALACQMTHRVRSVSIWQKYSAITR